MSSTPVTIGIDVSKAHLDVAARPSGESWRSANDEAGISCLVERLRWLAPELIVLEASGGWEVLAAGKPKMVALTACMDKLLLILDALVRHHTSWHSAAVQGA
jgi:transposase